MSKVLGLNCRTYQNTNSDADPATAAASPEWTVRNEVTSVSVDGSRATADVSSRGGGGYRQKVATLAEGSVSFDMIYDTADTTFFDIVDAAYRAGTTLDLWFANGSLDTEGDADADGEVDTTDTDSDGVRGFRAAFVVSNFSESQELEDANRYSVTLEVSGSIPTPGYYVKGGGASATYTLVSAS